MSKYTTDGVIVSNGEGFMGIFSTVSLLNDKIDRIKHLEQRLKEAEEALRFYNCHTSSETVSAFRYSYDTDSFIGEVPFGDYEILQEGSDSCNVFMGKRARAYFEKYGEKEEA